MVGRLLREYHLHGLPPSDVRRLGGSVHGENVTYLVSPPGATPILVRAFRADAPVPAQFSGSAAETMADWVIGRARTLAWLAEVGYPAPRPVRVRSGELVGISGVWLTWAVEFVAGPRVRPSLEQLEWLGESLGRLHGVRWSSLSSLSTGAEAGSGEPPGPPGKAAWHPDEAVATTIARLDLVAGLLPDDWRPMHTAFLRTARAVRDAAGLVPSALVHGDAWPGNAVESGPGQVTLVDWETAGLGLPVLDLGNCLAECNLDAGLPPDQPQAWLVQPDEQRIAAVARGYSRVRTLSAAERALLADGVRFGPAFVGAIHFQAALTGGASGPSMDARLARLRNRLDISDTVAELALRHLPGGSPPAGSSSGASSSGGQDVGTQ